MVVLRAKVIVTGDPAVGKSALTQAFHSDGTHFPKNYSMTTGVEVSVKSVNIPETSDSVELYLYDSAGKEIFTDIVQQHWTQPDMILVAYDMTNEQSFNACNKWFERCQAQKPNQSIPGALVAIKTDLKQRRVISTKQGREYANSKGLEYFECSPKDHENVEAPFYYLAKEFHNLYNVKIEQMKTLT
ncbi:PREDICTED: intraflagellar transport protein 27 homolog [Acropora digitifera]|uniref:intraflagellar transport protein 27 homolog n=1 Tax=Acropora digitifera TaxID=70779 RepID=UPI00077AADEB|nr:PREDICTED: intraflagellar transport protein 27 homolog [Acropora digitifera]